MLPGEEKVYLSADGVSKQNGDISSCENMHSTESLNSIFMSGLPNHELHLKLDSPNLMDYAMNKIDSHEIRERCHRSKYYIS